jgi:energy-converting hydrogenase Eha subunit E
LKAVALMTTVASDAIISALEMRVHRWEDDAWVICRRMNLVQALVLPSLVRAVVRTQEIHDLSVCPL